MIHECHKPVPCHTPLGDGYVWYITSSDTWDNDVLTIVLCKNGEIKHFTTDQVCIWANATFGIEKKSELPY